MNALVESKTIGGALAASQDIGRMAVADLIGHVAMVQEVMRAVMKGPSKDNPNGVHYGVIPGTDKPTLLKAGAEVLCMAFRIADSYAVEDLSTADTVRYRVTCIGTHQVTGLTLGTGMGEASSGEEKYKWRKASSRQEFDDTPPNLRRTKHGYNRTERKAFEIQQVRTEPADLANTILKMANKRAKMAMVLNVTAASDCFSQDLEDMDEALRDHLSRRGDDPAQHQDGAGAPPPPPPAPKPEKPEFDDAQFTKRKAKLVEFFQAGKTADEIITFYGTQSTIPEAMAKRIRELHAEVTKKVTDVEPKVTYAEVADKLVKAADLDQLADAGDLIGAVADESQRGELRDIHARRMGELNA